MNSGYLMLFNQNQEEIPASLINIFIQKFIGDIDDEVVLPDYALVSLDLNPANIRWARGDLSSRRFLDKLNLAKETIIACQDFVQATHAIETMNQTDITCNCEVHQPAALLSDLKARYECYVIMTNPLARLWHFCTRRKVWMEG